MQSNFHTLSSIADNVCLTASIQPYSLDDWRNKVITLTNLDYFFVDAYNWIAYRIARETGPIDESVARAWVKFQGLRPGYEKKYRELIERLS
jgi:hypothetical protein